MIGKKHLAIVVAVVGVFIAGGLIISPTEGVDQKNYGPWAYPRFDVPAGNVIGLSDVNKFGRAPNGIQTTATDIWDLADATPTQQIWLAPTAARIHAIVSTSTSDDGDPVGVGARTVKIWGLVDWDTPEASESITLNGTGAVNTSSAYVIIHRMKVTAAGASGPNVGTITATAATDSTITAAILIGLGQTRMAIYGVPSVKTLYMAQMYGSLDKGGGATVGVNITLLINEFPDLQPTVFISKPTDGYLTSGTSHHAHQMDPMMKITGPAIIKFQGISTAADQDFSARFSGYLDTN